MEEANAELEVEPEAASATVDRMSFGPSAAKRAKRKNGDRGPDTKPRKGRSCRLCQQFGNVARTYELCHGARHQTSCSFFDADGNSK